MSDRAKVLRAYAELRPRLVEIKEQAKMACVINPLAWLAVHGVSLAEHLAQIDELDALCAKCQDELSGAGA